MQSLWVLQVQTKMIPHLHTDKGETQEKQRQKYILSDLSLAPPRLPVNHVKCVFARVHVRVCLRVLCV
ncbi:hypothetical protein J4Q44_G00321400 [Coregonus suidteri]|uniref:Uncharacterized protein n=1 Tax=Coregonus suidteri TaxID=861788 RepID=A0AAN8KRQ8_9TELE